LAIYDLPGLNELRAHRPKHKFGFL